MGDFRPVREADSTPNWLRFALLLIRLTNGQYDPREIGFVS